VHFGGIGAPATENIEQVIHTNNVLAPKNLLMILKIKHFSLILYMFLFNFKLIC
jgi:hypothetical protein